MVNLIQKIISRLKKDPQYRINSNYSSREFLYILYYRFCQVLRGCYFKIFISSDGIIFFGRNVCIEHGYLVKTGSSCIIGDNVQINALSNNGVVLKNNVTIGHNSILTCTGVISNKGTGIIIGNCSAIGAQSFLGGQGGIEIGNDVIMGPQVKIFSENHNYEDPDVLIRKQGENRKGVKIGDNCWIGSGVTILDGVSIGKGCLIAAGSVVTSSVPENVILAGIPAKILKPRIKRTD